jgi:hypothetical protein
MGFDNQHGSIHDGFRRKAVLEQTVIFVHGPSVYACMTMWEEASESEGKAWINNEFRE